MAPGSEVAFSLEGGKIVITPVAAARVRASLAPEFRQLRADEIMTFLRGDAPLKGPRAAKAPGRSRR